MAKIIQVIETFDEATMGEFGNEMKSTYRLWSLDGKLLFEKIQQINKKEEK